MKNKILILLILPLFISGCITQKRCQSKFPPKNTTVDSIIPRSVIIKNVINTRIKIKYDSVFTQTIVTKTYGVCNSKEKIVETEFAKAGAKVDSGNLKLWLVQKDSIIKKTINDSIKFYYENHYTTKNIIHKVYITRWYDKAARVIAGIVLFFVIAKIAVGLIKI